MGKLSDVSPQATGSLVSSFRHPSSASSASSHYRASPRPVPSASHPCMCQLYPRCGNCVHLSRACSDHLAVLLCREGFCGSSYSGSVPDLQRGSGLEGVRGWLGGESLWIHGGSRGGGWMGSRRALWPQNQREGLGDLPALAQASRSFGF